MEDNILFSAVYFDEAYARAAWHTAYYAVVNDWDLDILYGKEDTRQ